MRVISMLSAAISRTSLAVMTANAACTAAGWRRPGPQRGLNLCRPGVDLAAVGPPQHRSDLGPRQPRGPVRIRRVGEQLERVGRVQVTEGLQGGGEVFP
jgi:hypothetical protein